MPTYLSLNINILGKSVLDCLYEYVHTIYTHTILDCYVDHDKPPLIYFNLSVTPDVLEEGASNVTVITDSLIGQFYICHSKNLSQQCHCYYGFFNWSIHICHSKNLSAVVAMKLLHSKYKRLGGYIVWAQVSNKLPIHNIISISSFISTSQKYVDEGECQPLLSPLRHDGQGPV